MQESSLSQDLAAEEQRRAEAADPALVRQLLVASGGLIGVGGCAIAGLRLTLLGADMITVLNLLVGLLGLAALWVARLQRLRQAVLLLLWGGWTLSTALTLLHGGARSLNLMNYPVLIVMASWLLGTRHAVAMTLVTALASLVFVAGRDLAWFPPWQPDPPLLTGLYLLLCLACVLIFSVMARRSYLRRVVHEHRLRMRLIVSQREMRRLVGVIEQSPSAVLVVDLSGRIDYANAVAQAESGQSEPLRGQRVTELPGLPVSPQMLEAVGARVSAGESWQGEFASTRPDGRARTELISVAPLRQGGDRSITHQAWRRQDVTAWREAEERLKHLRLHDELTGLNNLTGLSMTLGRLLARPSAGGESLALLAIGIERFSTVLSARGQEAADAVVRELGERLCCFLGTADHLARVGGDEFLALLPGLSPDEEIALQQAEMWAEQLHAAMLEPFELPCGDMMAATLRVGVAVSSQGIGAADLLRKARTALGHSRTSQRQRTEFFATTLGNDVEHRFLVESELRQAILQGELRLFLQPQVDERRQLVGAEALVRWIHPQRGMIPPGLFIPIAEESDLIVELGRWVMVEAVALIGREAAAGRALPLSVNLSPRQFAQPGFIPWLGGLLRLHHAPANQLTLEITEGLVIGDVEETIRRMQALRELGVHFSIDDFGTGYSSLAYLKRLPIEELKIDKSFIQEAPLQASDGVLVETILSVARHMNLKVVAEGVESIEQVDFLKARAENVVFQGYLFGRPRQAEEWLAHWREQGDMLPLPVAA